MGALANPPRISHGGSISPSAMDYRRLQPDGWLFAVGVYRQSPHRSHQARRNPAERHRRRRTGAISQCTVGIGRTRTPGLHPHHVCPEAVTFGTSPGAPRSKVARIRICGQRVRPERKSLGGRRLYRNEHANHWVMAVSARALNPTFPSQDLNALAIEGAQGFLQSRLTSQSSIRFAHGSQKLYHLQALDLILFDTSAATLSARGETPPLNVAYDSERAASRIAVCMAVNSHRPTRRVRSASTMLITRSMHASKSSFLTT